MEVFKCPNCGGNELIHGRCAYCDTTFNRPAEYHDVNLEYYFERFKPNRPKAIKALCKDTGMSIINAKRLIDQVFDERLNESHSDDFGVIRNNIKFAWKELRNE